MNWARFGWVFGVITALAVGTVIGAVLKSPPIWVTSSGGSNDGAAFYGQLSGRRVVASVLMQEVAKSPGWNGIDALPLSPSDAVASVRRVMSLNPALSAVEWDLEGVELNQLTKGKYIYVVKLMPTRKDQREDWVVGYQVLVYLNGKVQLPIEAHGT
jgi:hypothetical protein